MRTVAHVTHEAIQKIGGIGAVLQGLFTSKTYLDAVPRNILVGPYWPGEETGDRRLGPSGEVMYSGMDGISRSPLAGRLSEIERDFGVAIIYGRRSFMDNATGVGSSAEVILIDVSRFDAGRIGHFKWQLWEKFGINSQRYESIWDFEQYMRIAQPALACLHALGAVSNVEPCIILSHEYMGMPTVLASLLDGEAGKFRTVFHAHECAPMRRITEASPGYDTMFYNAMKSGMARGEYVDQVFGDQSDYYKTALVKATKYCDNVFAVGDETLREMRFLGPEMKTVPMQLAYNGVPCWKITPQQKMQSRKKLRTYCKTLLKFEPDFIFTHVTRLVPSKGLWRDLRVLEHVETRLRKRNETAVLFTLSTEVPGRRIEDIRRMEEQYHWPVVHREGAPDLSGGEAAYYAGVQEFNAQSRNVKVVFLNQFGFDPKTCGTRIPADMEFMDIRKGSDAEFGQSTYEPFGIAQVEPISFGGICVISNVCGCAGFVDKIAPAGTPNVIVADYTQLEMPITQPEKLLQIGKADREAIEDHVAAGVAEELVTRLPRTSDEFEPYLDRGYALAQQMSWDAVARGYILPGFEIALGRATVRASA